MDSEFIKVLDDWLFKNEKKFAESLKKQIGKVPQHFRQYTKPLYRGMIVEPDFLNAVAAGKLTFKDITSWTKSEKIALGFINDTKFKTTNKAGIKVMLTKKIPANKIILDIHNIVLFTGGIGLDELSIDSAFAEEEVLVDKGIKITKKDIMVVK